MEMAVFFDAVWARLDGEDIFQSVPSGAATCENGFVKCFLEVALACLGSMAAAVQPNSLRNSQITVYKNLFHNPTPQTVYIVYCIIN